MTCWPNGTKTKPYATSAFGPRRAPIPGASTFHRGVDLVGFARIRAVAPGRVVVAGTPRGWSGGGVQVWIQHAGFFTKSLHMRAGSLTVRVGDLVEEGADLGAMGRTGTATDVHLHFELTLGDVHYSNTGQIDPVAFIANRLSASAGGATTAPPVPEEDEDMPKLIRWRNLHVFSVAQEAILYVDSTEQKGTLEALHGRPVQDVDQAGLEAALDERGIHWAAVDAVLRKVAPGTGGRYWSRLMAEGIAIRGNQDAQTKTLADVLATAKSLESS